MAIYLKMNYGFSYGFLLTLVKKICGRCGISFKFTIHVHSHETSKNSIELNPLVKSKFIKLIQ